MVVKADSTQAGSRVSIHGALLTVDIWKSVIMNVIAIGFPELFEWDLYLYYQKVQGFGYNYCYYLVYTFYWL